jgi:hypothetical protein
MLNALALSGMYGTALEVLSGATERVVSALGIGTGVALLLGLLVLAAEALGRRSPRRKRRPRPRKPPARRSADKRRGAAYP